MKKISLTTIVVLIATILWSQTGTWYFGNAGKVAFNGTATSVPLGTPSINTSEGCGIVVDLGNQVVMYSDGRSLWNGVHTLITNNLGGDASSTHSALFVPIPGTGCNKYFLFTTAAVETDYGTTNAKTGFRVSMITVSGNYPYTITVNSLDQDLLTGTAHAGNLCAEKLAATSDGVGGYWVISHGVGTYNAGYSTPINTGGEAKFFRVRVTATTTSYASLQATLNVTNFPTFTHRSTDHPYVGSTFARFSGQGQMKFNTAGTRIAAALTYDKCVELYDFNSSTGAITNGLRLNSGSGAFDVGGTDKNTYAVEFSPASPGYLYVSTNYGGTLPPRLYQFNLSFTTAPTISTSRVTVAAGVNDYDFGALQLNANGRIYMAKNNQASIDVITTPNNAACGHVSGGTVIGGTCKNGLPTILVYDPCGSATDGCPPCGGIASISAPSCNYTGTGSVTFTLNGSNIRKVKIYIPNYETTTIPASGCLVCSTADMAKYASFTSTGVLNAVNGVFTPYSIATPTYSREVIYTFGSSQTFTNAQVTLNIQLPPITNNVTCQSVHKVMFKVEFIDDICQACEVQLNPIIYSAMGGGGGGGGRVIPSEGDSKPNGQVSQITLKPNPASHGVQIDLNGNTDGGNIEILSMDGKKVLEIQTPGSYNYVDTRSFPNGIYIVKFYSGKIILQEKLVIQN